MVREGTPQNFALRKGVTKQYVTTKNADPMYRPLVVLIKINLHLQSMLWRYVSKNEGGGGVETLRSLRVHMEGTNRGK
jgi:hypothetical protein